MQQTNIHFTISRSVLLRMRIVADRSCRENQNMLYFLKKLCYLQDKVANVVELGRPQMAIRCCTLHAGYQHTLRICNTY